MKTKICNIMKLILVGRVEGSMNSNYDPFYHWVVPCVCKVILEEIVLIRTQLVRMFWRKVHKMGLSIVEGEEKIRLTWKLPGQNVSIWVWGIIIVGFVISHSWHEGCVGCKLFCELSEKVPDRFILSFFDVIHASIGDISCEEDKVEGFDKVVLGYLVNNKVTKGSKSAHISKHSNVKLIKSLNLQRRSSKILHFWESSCLEVSNSIIVLLKWFEVFHDS